MIVIGMLLGIACGDYCYALIKLDSGVVERPMCLPACQDAVKPLLRRRVRVTIGAQPMVLHGPEDFQDGVLQIAPASRSKPL